MLSGGSEDQPLPPIPMCAGSGCLTPREFLAAADRARRGDLHAAGGPLIAAARSGVGARTPPAVLACAVICHNLTCAAARWPGLFDAKVRARPLEPVDQHCARLAPCVRLPGPAAKPRAGVLVYSSGSEPYRVNAAIINSTGRRKVKFMCCSLAFNDHNTIATLPWIRGITPESTEDPRSLGGVFESGAGVVPAQAGNRRRTIQASPVAMPGG